MLAGKKLKKEGGSYYLILKGDNLYVTQEPWRRRLLYDRNIVKCQLTALKKRPFKKCPIAVKQLWCGKTKVQVLTELTHLTIFIYYMEAHKIVQT